MDLGLAMYGSMKKPKRYACGGWTGCEKDHDFYDPKDVLLVHEALTQEDLRACDDWSADREKKARANGTIFFRDDHDPPYAVPTMLGEWYDEVSSN